MFEASEGKKKRTDFW